MVDDTNASFARLEGIKADTIGKNHRIADANGRYIEYCKGSFPYHLNLSNLKIVIDCANGAGYSVAPRVLQELGAQVIAIHTHQMALISMTTVVQRILMLFRRQCVSMVQMLALP